MTAISISLFVLLGLLAGALSGLIGIGGGVILVPALVFLFGMSEHLAQGTTLALMVPPIGLLAAWAYYKRGYVDLRIAALVCLGFSLGGLTGARLAVLLSTVMIERVFGVGLILIALKMLLSPDEAARERSSDQTAHPKQVINAGSAAAFVLLGLVTGATSGLLGIGGGIILVPALAFLFGLSQHEAQGTTLALMVPPIGLLAAWQYYQRGDVDVTVGALICAGFFVGTLLGAKLAASMPSRVLTRVFGVAMLLIAIKMLYAA